MNTHTPGPWKATWRGAGGWAISNCVWTEYLRDARLTKEDAHLIAAAPSLLAALREIELVLHPDADEQSPLVRGTRECGEVIQNIVNRARAALAKVDA